MGFSIVSGRKTDSFSDRSAIVQEARRLEAALKRQLEEKASRSPTGHFKNQNRWSLGEDTWMPRYRHDYSGSGFLVMPRPLETAFFEGSMVGWHVELLPAQAPANILRLVVVGDTVMGRGSNADLDLGDYQAEKCGVSRQHLMLRPAKHCLYAIDMGSTNGTFINGLPLSCSSAYALQPNSVLTLGRLVFTVKLVYPSRGRVAADDSVDDPTAAQTSPFEVAPQSQRTPASEETAAD